LFFYIAILVRIILSFVIPMMEGRPHPLVLQLAQLANQVTEPILAPIRRVLPTFGSLDFSPMAAILLLTAIQWALSQAVS
jgi:YggT family protein